MNKLEKARLEINDVDAKMAELFSRRFKAVQDVLAYKKENNLPIFDPVREKQVIERNTKLVEEDLQPYYEAFLISMMNISKQYQKELLEEE